VFTEIENFGPSSVIEVALAYKKTWKSSSDSCIKLALIIYALEGWKCETFKWQNV
jgi:hypothetical protein